MRPEQRAGQANRDCAVNPYGQLGVVRHAGQRPMDRTVVEEQRCERRRGRNNRVAQRFGDPVPCAVAARLGQRPPSGCEHDATAVNSPVDGGDGEASGRTRDTRHPLRCQ